MKKITVIKTLVLSAVCLSGMTTAYAALPLPMGWYIETNLGAGRTNDITYATNTTNNNSGYAYNINIGYKFIPFFAAELGYTNYAKTNIEYNNVKFAKAMPTSYDLAVKGILPIQDAGFEAFAKLGWARAKSHVTLTDIHYATTNDLNVNPGTYNSSDVYMGLGAEYSFTPSLAVNAQWARADGKNSNTGVLDLFSLGLAYTFG